MWSARRVALTVVALLLAVGTLSACSEDGQPSVVQPTSAFRPTGPTTLPGETAGKGPVGQTADGTTAIAELTGVAPGDLSSGRVSITIAGDIRARKSITELISPVYAAPPGGMALVWTAGGTDATTFGLGGLSFTGRQVTSPTLSVTLTVQTKNAISTFVSSAGECTVTISAADADQITGDFACEELSSGTGQIVDANGSFNAHR